MTRPDSSPSHAPDEPLDRLLASDGLLPVPRGLRARVMEGIGPVGFGRLRLALGGLVAAAALFLGAFLVLGAQAPALARGIEFAEVAAVVEDAREAAPLPEVATTVPAPARGAPLVVGALGLVLLAAGPLLGRRWRSPGVRS